MHRTEKKGDFTPIEARLMARLSRPVADALRSSYPSMPPVAATRIARRVCSCSMRTTASS